MINIVDLLWIEQRGMSIITAIFFFGVFITIGSFFWWVKREVADIDAVLADYKLRINDTQSEVSHINVKLGKIQVTVENTEDMTGKLLSHVLK